MITSQLPTDRWHGVIGDPTMADAILDRLVHNAQSASAYLLWHEEDGRALPGFEFAAWIGVMVASGTPKPIVDKITGAVDKVLQTQDARDKLGSVGLDVNYHRAEQMGAYLTKQSAQVADIIKRANIRVE